MHARRVFYWKLNIAILSDMTFVLQKCSNFKTFSKYNQKPMLYKSQVSMNTRGKYTVYNSTTLSKLW